MNRSALALTLAAVSVLAACSAKRPEENRAGASRSVANPDGPVALMPKGERIVLEIAANPDTRQRGLMFRDSLAADRGMLFLFPESDVYSFWMKNTLIPLDMIWLDEANRIVHIKQNVPPCQADPCPSYSPEMKARSVLELAAGRAAQLSLKVGDVIQISNIDSYRLQ